MPFIHKNLAQGRWQELSFAEQIGNIGSELARARSWSAKGKTQYKVTSLERALELIDLTLESVKTAGQRKEVARLREVVAGLYVDDSQGEKIFAGLECFYLPFALLARR
ncbi:MAG: hypothetical protein Q8Q23_03400 [bacterium]|nr:hypothetical protein [bacterium]